MSPTFTSLVALCLERRSTFAAFRIPGKQVELFVQQTPTTECIAWEDLDRTTDRFLVHPFTVNNPGPRAIKPDVRIGPDPSIAEQKMLVDRLGTHGSMEPIRCPGSTTEQAFKASVSEAVGTVANGHLHKVVLSRVVTVDLGIARLPALFAHAISTRPEAFVALVSLPEHGTWLGASPERLMRMDRGAVHVDSLAGTMPSARAVQADAWGDKERREQALVTTSVIDAFRSTGYTDPVTDGPNVWHAGPVAHLRTTVSAPLGGRSAHALVHELHPTPAVCGTPRNAAKAFIAAHEIHDRGLYTGFWGPWRSSIEADLFVNIRCLQHIGDKAAVYAGAGITAGSSADGEWRETTVKAGTWLDAIAALE